MTRKQEFLSQGVDDLRSSLQDMFEDPDGEFESMNKPSLLKFAKTNWETIEGLLPTDEPVVEVEEPEEVEEEVPLVPELPEEESPVTEEVDEDWHGDPATNLHTGNPGRSHQRVSNKDLV